MNIQPKVVVEEGGDNDDTDESILGVVIDLCRGGGAETLNLYNCPRASIH